ncbi:MAG: TGS domain-containing protein, partial [Methylococcales bacterium]|nr:TGS domain-containing protein [Methylococcales bacterium]
MLVITLPDGSQRNYDAPLSVLEVAQSIGAGFAKATLAGKVNGKLVDASTIIEHDVQLHLVTAKDDEGLDVIRHSTAHLLAQAVKQLFPEAQVTIGPVIENGFYYDFAYSRPFTPEDLEKIEAKMQQFVSENIPLSRSVLSRDEAINFFKNQGETYKVEIIESIPVDQDLSLYQQGDFIDLCRGPHVPNTGKLGAFKLMKIAGAYWRADAKNEMLQRVYGTAWRDKKELQAYLTRLEEAEKRDHRKLAKTLDFFHIQE